MSWLVFAANDTTRTRLWAPAVDAWPDIAARDVWVDGQHLNPPLSPAQFKLLRALIDRTASIATWLNSVLRSSAVITSTRSAAGPYTLRECDVLVPLLEGAKLHGQRS